MRGRVLGVTADGDSIMWVESIGREVRIDQYLCVVSFLLSDLLFCSAVLFVFGFFYL